MTVDFSKIQSTSLAAGFENYKVVPFSQSIAGQTLPLFSGTLHHYTTTITLPLSGNTGSLVLSNVLINLDNDLAAGKYYSLSSQYLKTFTIGSSGGFPIFYEVVANVNNDSNNLYIVIDISNPSAVNAVTVPTIVASGKVFFYLAPF